MTENARTPFAGLLRVAPGEPLSIEGFEFQYIDPLVIDRILKLGAVTHKHDGGAAVANPAEPLTLDTEPTGGGLPPATQYISAYTLIDAQGGETLPSPSVNVTTAGSFPEPKEAPATEIKTTAGMLLAGNYVYGVTVTDGKGGETIISPLAGAVVPSGTEKAEVILSKLKAILTEVAGATEGAEWRLWRRLNGGEWNLIGTGVTEEFTDDGTETMDCSVEPPSVATVQSTCKLTFKLPKVEAGAVAYRVYLTDETGFGPVSFFAEYPASEEGKTITISALALQPGSPPPVSRAYQHANKINPDTELQEWPWKKAVEKVGELPTVGNGDGDVREVLEDHSLHIWDATSKAWGVIEGGGGGSSLVIKDPAGTHMPAEPDLQFVGTGVTVTDDPVHTRTVVEITPGTLIEYKGEWDSETAYMPGNIVTAGGGSYLALEENAGIDPTTDTEHWGILAMPGAAGTGEGITWLGAWSNATTYAVNDAVSRLGSSYVNKSAGNIGHDPATDASVHWDTIAEAGRGLVWRGEWVVGTAYDALDLVQQGGTTYISKAAGNIGHSPAADTTFTYWEVFVLRGAVGPAGAGEPGPPGPMGTGLVWKGVWNAATAYKANDAVQAGGSAFVATGASTGVSPVNPNAVFNGGAENAETGNLEARKTATVTRSEEHAKSGDWSYEVAITPGSQNSGMGLSGNKWSSGDHLHATAWVYGEEGEAWRMALYSTSSSFIAATGAFSVTGWNLVSVSGTAPGAATNGKVVIDGGAHNITATWFVDDINVNAGNWDLLAGGDEALVTQVESHTWALPGPVTGGGRPGFFIMLGEDEDAQKIIGITVKTQEGHCGVTICVNGSAVTGLESISAESEKKEIILSEADIKELATGDYVELEVEEGEEPVGLTVTIFTAKS